jgi:hypothetical protein
VCGIKRFLRISGEPELFLSPSSDYIYVTAEALQGELRKGERMPKTPKSKAAATAGRVEKDRQSVVHSDTGAAIGAAGWEGKDAAAGERYYTL